MHPWNSNTCCETLCVNGLEHILICLVMYPRRLFSSSWQLFFMQEQLSSLRLNLFRCIWHVTWIIFDQILSCGQRWQGSRKITHNVLRPLFACISRGSQTPGSERAKRVSRFFSLHPWKSRGNGQWKGWCDLSESQEDQIRATAGRSWIISSSFRK